MEPQPHMPRKSSRLVRYVAIALIVLFMPIFVLGATIAATGTVTIDVETPGPDGVDLYLPVPALIFDLAAFAVPRLVPDEALADARREIAPYRGALEAFADALEDCPEGVLVHVESPTEEVRVTKSWRSFEVEVHGDDGDVEISIPARLVSRALDIL